MASPQVIQAIIRAGRPHLRSKHDRLAYAVHAYLLADGYKLVATGKDANKPPEDIPADAPEVSLEGWQDSGEGYTLAYTDTTGKRTPILVKMVPMGSRLLLHWVAPGIEPRVLELPEDEYVDDEASADDVASGFKNLADLVSKLQSTFSAGAAHEQAEAPTAAAGPSSKQAAGGNLSASAAEWRPADKRHTDTLPEDIDPLARGPPRRLDGQHTPGVGEEGLIPPGFPPPGQGMPYPPYGMPGPGGMHVGPNDPLFRGGGRGPFQGGPGGLADPYSGVPGGLPPGARWDPIRPPGMEGFRPGDFQRNAGRGMGGGGVHPDIMPPGPGRGQLYDDGYF